MTNHEFYEMVLRYVQRIPPGKVATYGQVAKLAGKPQGSRGVAWILHSSSTKHKLPWHRILNAQGRISFERGSYNFRKQCVLLSQEGVSLSVDGKLSLSKYQWKTPGSQKSIRKANKPHMFEQ